MTKQEIVRGVFGFLVLILDCVLLFPVSIPALVKKYRFNNRDLWDSFMEYVGFSPNPALRR